MDIQENQLKKSFKITFIIPSVLIGKRAAERVSGCTYTIYPVPNIYELTVVTVIEKNGFEVDYVDSVLNNWKEKDFVDFIKKDQSNIYSIWAVNLSKENDLVAHSIIRKLKPTIPIIFMGPAPTFFIDEFLPDESTYIVRGEPEYTTLELIQGFSRNLDVSNIKGISFKKDGKVINSPSREPISNLDSLPFPARHLINKNKYHNPKLKNSPYTPVVTSRNCPHQCIYCVPSSLTFAREIEFKRDHGRKPPVRLRSAENVIEELKILKEQGYKSISFQDDLFIQSKERTKKICSALKELDFVWGCQSRADKLDEEIVKTMADSGCKYVDIGVESFDQKILDYVKKGTTVETNVKAIKLLKKYGIAAKINVLFGTSPLETKETIDNTYKMIRELDADQVMFNIVSPFPGTEFYNIVRDNDWFIDGDYKSVDVQKRAITSFPNLSKEEMEKAVFIGNLKFYLSPKFIIRNITKFQTYGDFYTSLKGLYRKLLP
ncbi:B12-binding domain-containing radical SAM protein [Candidatus Methanoperedens nitratireducens]|uniref:Uncharacterized protein n=1 Tax=Candidatus Methanoperedens nitratireducens TaxID=1392998 RepID=A0A284VNZ1_9EURY|nr:radical SAM protein [Candidatus Methanoperedens nitroreducens]SNQ60929.1 conserved hypothetical protein [Candidatus Methanoperedens nitroreducens]